MGASRLEYHTSFLHFSDIRNIPSEFGFKTNRASQIEVDDDVTAKCEREALDDLDEYKK